MLKTSFYPAEGILVQSGRHVTMEFRQINTQSKHKGMGIKLNHSSPTASCYLMSPEIQIIIHTCLFRD